MQMQDILEALRAAHAAIGNEGRFSMTLDTSGKVAITHWFRPSPEAFEDCKAVGYGTLSECLVALGRYVSAYQRPLSDYDVGLMIGVIEPPARTAIAAE